MKDAVNLGGVLHRTITIDDMDCFTDLEHTMMTSLVYNSVLVGFSEIFMYVFSVP